MLLASDLKRNTVLRINGALYRVVEANYHTGGGKVGGMMHAKLKEIGKNHFAEKRFHPDDKLEDVDVEKKSVEFSYETGDEYYFMDPVSYDQVSFRKEQIGPAAAFIREGMKVSADFLDGNPIDITLPELVKVEVVSTGAAVKGETDGTYKEAELDNGQKILVPQFIKQGDKIMVRVQTGEYAERVKKEKK